MPTPTSRGSAGARTPDAFDIPAVPFPFADRAAQMRRPAVAPSCADAHRATGHTVCAIVARADNAPWPHDVRIAAGLPAPSVIRLKCFAIDDRLALPRAGTLAGRARPALKQTLEAVRDV